MTNTPNISPEFLILFLAVVIIGVAFFIAEYVYRRGYKKLIKEIENHRLNGGTPIIPPANNDDDDDETFGGINGSIPYYPV